MRNLSAFFCTCLVLCTATYAQKNMTLVGSLSFPGQTLAGVWHYEKQGVEYALVGASSGIAVVDLTSHSNPQVIHTLPGLQSLWHEIKVLGDYAYAVAEAEDSNGVMNGVQIIDLSNLPASVQYRFYDGDGSIAGQLKRAHSITADNGYVYVNGHQVPGLGGGVLILDVSDPWNPVYTGAITNHYCHDSYVRGDTIWTSDIYTGGFSVYDISNRTAPVLLNTQQTPGSFNHNSWLSDNSRYLFTTDEVSGAPIASYDVSDVSNITELDRYYTINMFPAEAHNVRVLNDFIINASYGSQVTLVDASHPDNLIEVGNYPTGSGLCWDADPYLPSGHLIATDTWTAMFYVFMPDYIRACFLEGLVTDSVSGLPVFNALVQINSISLADSTRLNGEYKTGFADAGMYEVIFSKSGYRTDTFTVSLANGQVTVLNVRLVPSNIGIQESLPDELISYHYSGDLTAMEVTSKSPGALSVSLSDISGRVIYQTSVAGNATIKLPVQQLSRGIYHLNIFLQGGQLAGSKKIVRY